MGDAVGRRVFKIVLIKPSHYDADGYVIQWWRSTIPSNSLASVYGLLEECALERVLGQDVDIEIDACDECNTIVDVAGTIRAIRDAGSGFVGLVGVQSNQFPRALDLGRRFRAAGLPVIVGGFHVSGCISMLPEMPVDLKEALDLGISLYAGEAEGRMEELVRDIDAGTLKPVYNYLHDLPDMGSASQRALPRPVTSRIAGHYAGFDAGRGCPFQCSFCTIINVQGRKSRYRSADEVEALIRDNARQGVTRFFVTDDNFARNKNWEAILDRLIKLREQDGFKIKILLQVDTLWHKAKVITWAGYILGFPNDTPESIARDIEIIKKELPIDILEFFFLTPLPGSEDHKKLYLRGVPMEPDMNKYDLEHACTAHPIMSKETWQKVYRDAWKRYYTDEHVETVLRRGLASGLNLRKIIDPMTIFSGASRIEGVHPLQYGYVRRKMRTHRRYGMRIVNPIVFYPRRAFDFTVVALGWLRLFL